MINNSINWLKWVSEVAAIAQTGLTYTENEFDKERFIRLRAMVAEIAAHCSDKQLKEIEQIFSIEKGYATPKIDIRSFVLKDNEVLLVRERVDGLWSLPGGWADVNESPSTAVIRETKEETGYEVSAIKLLALWDKLKHDHPLQWPHAYKCFFHCEIIAGEPSGANLEILDIGFFELLKLPDLSTHRVTEKQLARLYELVKNPQPTQFD